MIGVSDRLSDMPGEGDVLAGKYRLERRLGRGGMGEVFAASHTGLGQRVAVKLLLPEYLRGPTHLARFRREARAAARIASEHVARVLDSDETAAGVPFIVMEYLEGIDLGRVLARDGALPIDTACLYLMQACAGVAEAHALGIIHRDLKPQNLFLASSSDGRRIVKLLDFGVSKLAPSPAEVALTAKDAALGSPAYMSPEQRRSAADVDHRSDIWSLGVVLYELIAGVRPFQVSAGGSLTQLIAETSPVPLVERRPEVPADLDAAVLRCLAKDPRERFADVADLARALAPHAPSGTELAQRIEHVLARAAALDPAAPWQELPSVSGPTPQLTGPPTLPLAPSAPAVAPKVARRDMAPTKPSSPPPQNVSRLVLLIVVMIGVAALGWMIGRIR